MRSVPILCLGFLALSPAQARGDEDAVVREARALFERGEKDFEAGKFVEAAANFEAAYKLTPRPDLLYDAGHAYDKAGNAARAVEMYEAYLRAGDALPDETRVRQRLEDLRPKVAYLLVRANKDGATVIIDGKERGTTPMRGGVPVLSGMHRVEVRLGDMVWRSEQEFATGLTHTVDAVLAAPAAPEEEERPARRFVAVAGLGGVIDLRGRSFPPSQAQIVLGFDYRALERKTVSIDVTARVPLEVAQGWTNVAILPGVRVVLALSRKYGLELVPSLDVGLGILHVSKLSAPLLPTLIAPPCGVSNECTLPGLRIHPALNLVYRFLPNWELRAELIGLVADITSPLLDPRVSFGVTAAWRFH